MTESGESGGKFARPLKFLASLAIFSSIYTVLQWPASTGNAHWSEWFVYYFSPAFSISGIFCLIAYIFQRVQVKKGKRDQIKLPLTSIFWIVTAFLSFGLAGTLIHGS